MVDLRCPECGSPLNTNGRLVWCSLVGDGPPRKGCRFGLDRKVPIAEVAPPPKDLPPDWVAPLSDLARERFGDQVGDELIAMAAGYAAAVEILEDVFEADIFERRDIDDEPHHRMLALITEARGEHPAQALVRLTGEDS